MLVRMAWRRLRADVTRTAFTLLGIGLSIFLLSSILIISTSFTASLRELLEEFGGNHVYVTPGLNPMPGGNAHVFHDETLRALRGVNGVREAIGIRLAAYQVGVGGETRILPVMFITLGNPSVVADAYKFTSMLREGRFFQSADEPGVILGADAADKVFSRPVHVREILRVDGKAYRVIGVYGKLGTPDDRNVYLPYAVGQKDFGIRAYDMIDLIVQEGVDTASLEERVERLVKRLEGFTPLVLTPEAVQEEVSDTLGLATAFLSMLALVSLIISLISLANTYLAIVEQRRREIGTLRALGMQRWQLALLIMIEAGMVTLLALLAAYVLSILVLTLLTPVFRQALPTYQLIIPSHQLVGIGVIVLLAAMLLAALPSMILQREEIISLLRS